MIEYVGQQLGNYRLLHLLGRGGFAHVYAGEHVYLKTRAAIKVLHVEAVDQRHNDFLKEAQTLAHLVHSNIIRTLEFGVEGDIPFLVMDYAPNGSLRQLHPKGMRLPLETAVSYVKQIAAALDYAHSQNVIHRDVKPANVFLGEHCEALLGDFGLALIAHSSKSALPEEVVMGTAPYMAPEQICGEPCPASDQYSLAIAAYEWLSGTCPFHGSFTEILTQQMIVPPPAIHTQERSIPADVETVIMTALSKDPRDRFTSVEAFAHALELASQPASQSATPITQPKPEHQSTLLHPQSLPIVSPPSSPQPLPKDNEIVSIPSQ